MSLRDPESSTPTIADLLAEGARRIHLAGSKTAELDAELLLSFATGIGQADIGGSSETPISETAVARFRSAVARREAGEPVAYIRGHKQFYGLVFRTDRGTFIPRPATERLVELAYHELARLLRVAYQSPRPRPVSIVDVGTGSGAIIVALAVLLRLRGALDAVRLSATDVSASAVEIARWNAIEQGLGDLIAFEVCDLLPDVGTSRWDLVLANLPYIRRGAVDRLPPFASFEPRLALDGGVDGFAIVSRLLDRLPDVLAPGGAAIVEIGTDQRPELVKRIQTRLPGWSCELPPDYGAIIRPG